MILARGGATLPNASNVYLSTVTWPQTAAHRVTTTRFGEETVQSALQQLAAGIKVLDWDLWFSSNDGAILMHDETLDRTSNGTGNIVSSTTATIAGLRVDAVGSGQNPQKIPTMADLVQFKGRAIVTVEHKPGPGTTQVAALAASLSGMEDSLIIQSFWGTATDAWLAAGFTVMALYNQNTAAPATLYAAGYRWIGHTFTGTGTDPEKSLITASKAEGLQVMTYTHTTGEQVAAAVAAGSDMPLMDNPAGK